MTACLIWLNWSFKAKESLWEKCGERHESTLSLLRFVNISFMKKVLRVDAWRAIPAGRECKDILGLIQEDLPMRKLEICLINFRRRGQSPSKG